MKKNILLLSYFLLSFVFIKAQETDLHFSEKKMIKESNEYLLKSTFYECENYGLYDLIYQRMEWDIDPNIRYIKGEITSHFKSEINNLSEIEFDLHQSLTVDSITQNNQQIGFFHNENKILVQLNKALQNQQIDSICIYYRGEPGGGGFGSFEKSEHQGIPIIWTLSEPYGAKDWWPCKQSLSDKIDSIDIIVTSPELYRTASNGVVASETVENGIRRTHWKHRFPITTYLVAIAVTNYSSYSDYLELEGGEQIEILNYVYPEDLNYAKSRTPATVDIMRLFNNIVGEYPFASEKYGHAQFGWGGGMEHQTMSFMGHFEFYLVAHELAHQWFGDYITLGTWQDIWLNEGFATYMTGLAYENLTNSESWLQWKKDNVKTITSNYGGSVFVSDTTSISRIFSGRLSYSKGAHLLHMLRWILGDEIFFEGIRNYFNDPEIANGFARTYQIVEHLENVGDTILTEFFNDWYYGEGFPIYSVNYISVDAETLQIELSQNSSHGSIDFFEMPVPVRVYNFDKTDSADFRLINTENNQEFVVNPGFEVAELKLDPDFWLVSKTSEIVSTPLTKVSDDIRIYPNPFNDKLNILYSSNQITSEINIFSVEGKLLKQLNKNHNTFDLSNLLPGVYILQIKSSDEIFEQKIVKQ